MIKPTFLIILFCSIISGCATTTYDDFTVPHTLNILSDPVGAKIEINGNYIGSAPIQYTFKFTADPYLYPQIIYYNPVVLRIKAYPISEGQYTQNKQLVINPSQKETIPDNIYFDMNLIPHTPSMDININ